MHEETSGARATRIRDLNDRLRLTGEGGLVVVTSGVSERGREFVAAALEAVRAFDAFTPENDPYDEHDFGFVEVDGQDIYFKMDLYEDPSVKAADGSPVVTHVLTIMLAEEY